MPEEVTINESAFLARWGVEVSEFALQSKWERTRSWCELIAKTAGEFGFDPYLIAAMVWQESGGDPEVISNNGAVGLMQVMPSDGIAARFQCKFGPCFANRPTTKELQNPEFNLKYGCKLLAEKVAMHNGNLRFGLFGYGPAEIEFYYADTILGLTEILKGEGA